MAEHAKRTESKRVTWYGNIINWALRVIMALFLGLFISILVEWVGMAFFYSDEGYHHAKQMYQIESQYLDNEFKQSFVTSSPIALFTEIKNTVYKYTIEKTAIEKFLLDLANDPDLKYDLSKIPKPHENAPFNEKFKYYQLYWSKGYKQVLQDYLLSAVFITQVYSVRVTILFLSIPMLVIAIVYGASKGLNERSVRKWSGGRESSTVFHWAKMLWSTALISPFIIYLAIPFSLHPSLVILPCAGVIAFITFYMTASYKKYL